MKKSFTLIETLVVLAIFLFFLTASFTINTPKKEKTQDIIFLLLNQARTKAITGEQNSSWGVRVEQEQAVLFQTNPYQERKKYEIISSEEKEFVFNQDTGFSLKEKIKGIYINELGVILREQVQALPRQKIDSRRVIIDYGRIIKEKEEIILNEESFLIKDFLKNNNIYFKKNNLLIETLSFNDPGTIFVIKRDRRFHKDPLTIFLSGDDYSIIEYSGDGLETNYQSNFVKNLKWE